MTLNHKNKDMDRDNVIVESGQTSVIDFIRVMNKSQTQLPSQEGKNNSDDKMSADRSTPELTADFKSSRKLRSVSVDLDDPELRIKNDIQVLIDQDKVSGSNVIIVRFSAISSSDHID